MWPYPGEFEPTLPLKNGREFWCLKSILKLWGMMKWIVKWFGWNVATLNQPSAANCKIYSDRVRFHAPSLVTLTSPIGFILPPRSHQWISELVSRLSAIRRVELWCFAFKSADGWRNWIQMWPSGGSSRRDATKCEIWLRILQHDELHKTAPVSVPTVELGLVEASMSWLIVSVC